MSGKGCGAVEPCVTQGLSGAVVIQERVQRWLGVHGSQICHKALSVFLHPSKTQGLYA